MQGETTRSDLEDMARRSYGAFARRDVDRALADYASDIVWDMSALGMGVYEGREATRGFLKDWLDPFEDYDQEVEEFRELGNGVTFAVALQRGRPAGGNGFVEVRYAAVNTWADRMIQRVALYTDLDEARAAAQRLARERRYAPSDMPVTNELLAKLKGSVEAYVRGDFDEAAAVYLPRGVLDLSPLGIGIFEGRDAVGALLADWFEPYEDITVEVLDLRRCGDHVTFGVLLYSGRPAGSSRLVEVRHAYTSVWTDGLIERTVAYADVDEARAAAEQLAGRVQRAAHGPHS